jgi:hypothetical protein
MLRCRAAPADVGVPLIEFAFILSAHRPLVNVFELRDFSSNFDELAGRRRNLPDGSAGRSEKVFLLCGHGSWEPMPVSRFPPCWAGDVEGGG